jgi:Protein of unknown function (DUF3108)
LISRSPQPAKFVLLLLLQAATPLLPQSQRSTQQPIATIAPASQIVPPPANYRFPNGQTYVLSVEWHFFNAGVAKVKMEPAGALQKVTAVADSLGTVNLLYGIHDRFEGYFDPRSFCSQRVFKHTEEGSRRRETEVRYDYQHRKSVLTEKNLKTQENKRVENDVSVCVTDVVTGFYYLATQQLIQGRAYTFPINDGGKTTDVRATIGDREQIKVPAGTFGAVKVEAEPIAGPLKGKGKVWVWFTDDANHTPVQMRAKLGWGTLVFKLQRVERQ